MARAKQPQPDSPKVGGGKRPTLLDQAMESAGPFGCGQLLVIGFMSFTWMLLAVGFSLPIFIAADPEREVASCPPASALPKGETCEVGAALPRDAWCNDSLRPYWRYVEPERYITAEWDLICDDSYLAASAGGLLFMGVMAGNLAFSPVPDRIGRCPSYVCGITLATLGSGVCARSWSYSMYLAGRFILGLGQGCVANVSYVSATEVVGAAYTSSVMAAMMCMWAGGMLMLVASTLATQDWRALSHVHALLLSVLFVGSLAAKGAGLESPSWLASRGDEERLHRVMGWLARMNGRVYVAPIAITRKASGKQDGSKEGSQEGARDVLCTQPLALWSRIFMLAFAGCSLGYYGLSLDSGHLGSSVRMSMALSAVVEIPAVFAARTLVDLPPVGRTGTVVGGIGFSGAFCLISALLPEGTPAATMAAVVGKMFVSVAYNAIFVLVGDVYPATVRGFAFGIFMTASRVTGIMAPYIVALEAPWPLLIIGTFLLAITLPLFSLPETVGQESVPTSCAEVRARLQGGEVKFGTPRAWANRKQYLPPLPRELSRPLIPEGEAV